MNKNFTQEVLNEAKKIELDNGMFYKHISDVEYDMIYCSEYTALVIHYAEFFPNFFLVKIEPDNEDDQDVDGYAYIYHVDDGVFNVEKFIHEREHKTDNVLNYLDVILNHCEYVEG